MFSSSIVWAVGGMSSVSQLGQHRVLVEDVVELALEARQLLVGQAEAREMSDVLDVVARQGGMPDDSRRARPDSPGFARVRPAADRDLGRALADFKLGGPEQAQG